MDFSLAGADAAFLGESSGDQSGRRVAGAGDVNADGYDDLLIGAPHNARGGENAGAAYLVYGRPDADWGDAFPLSQADVIYVGEGADHFSGYDVARAGDVDGDGIDDLLIGAYAGKIQAVPGRAYVIYGSGEGLPQPVTFTPDGPQGKVGEWRSFTTTYGDSNVWSDIASARLQLGTSVADLKALNVLYEPATNALFLRNSTDTAWLGPCTPGTHTKLSNNVVQLDCLQSSITHDGDDLQVVWRGRWIQRISRARPLTAHLRAVDQAGHDSGFVPLGTWTLTP
jgi:FG-GAP repeat